MNQKIIENPKGFIVEKIYEPDKDRMKKALEIVMKYDPKQSISETDRRIQNATNLNKT